MNRPIPIHDVFVKSAWASYAATGGQPPVGFEKKASPKAVRTAVGAAAEAAGPYLRKAFHNGAPYIPRSARGPKIVDVVPGPAPKGKASVPKGGGGPSTTTQTSDAAKPWGGFRTAREHSALGHEYAAARARGDKATMEAISEARKALKAPEGFFHNMAYRMGRLNPGNSYTMAKGGFPAKAIRAAAPLATGLGGYGYGSRVGAERAVTDMVDRFESMPYWQRALLGAGMLLPNFGQNEWAVDTVLSHLQDSRSPLEKILGPNYDSVRGTLDDRRKARATARQEEWEKFFQKLQGHATP